MKIPQVLLVALLLCGASASTTLAEHHGSSGDTLLVIKRSPTFGTKQGCSITIDGVSYGIIGYNRRLETSVTPGEHVVTMQPVPNYRRPGLRNQQRIHLHAGQRNVFTLSWSGDVPVLK
jgi:hypothetical protein